MPVLKHHDTGGSEITGAVKHFYGLVSMADGQSGARHYQALGETCGRMIAAVRSPVLNVMDAIWVSHRALGGYPVSATHRANQLLASQDPVALDYWSAKAVLHPVDSNPRHSPDRAGIDRWLTDCMNLVNSRGGIARPAEGIHVGRLTKLESEFRVVSGTVARGPARSGVNSSPEGQPVLVSHRAGACAAAARSRVPRRSPRPVPLRA